MARTEPLSAPLPPPSLCLLFSVEHDKSNYTFKLRYTILSPSFFSPSRHRFYALHFFPLLLPPPPPVYFRLVYPAFQIFPLPFLLFPSTPLVPFVQPTWMFVSSPPLHRFSFVADSFFHVALRIRRLVPSLFHCPPLFQPTFRARIAWIYRCRFSTHSFRGILNFRDRCARVCVQ